MIEDVTPFTETTESTLKNVLRSYYKLCRTCPDRSVLTKDGTLLQTLASYVAEKDLKISAYVCKILVALTALPECAATLSADENLLKSVSAACNDAELPIQISKNLMMVLSRMKAASSMSANSRADSLNINQQAQESTKKSFFGKANKQFVFSFDHPTELQRRQMEANCLSVRGVVSVCFQYKSSLYAKCILRCRDDVDPKAIAIQLLRTGLEVVQLSVRLADGSHQTFDFYANDESLASGGNMSHHNDKSSSGVQLPAYIDDDEVADPTQCVITKEQLEAQQRAASGVGGWLSSLKFW